MSVTQHAEVALELLNHVQGIDALCATLMASPKADHEELCDGLTLHASFYMDFCSCLSTLDVPQAIHAQSF